MGKIAFLFAGQGAQSPGMGQSLYQTQPAAKAVFDMAEQLRPGTIEDCFNAPAQRLSQTDVTQPCVFAVDLAAANALAEKGIKPEAVAGFSLGEMAALTFAGAFTQQDGFALVCKRGEIMNEAAQQNPGAMAAVLKLPNEKVEELCGRFAQMYPVNYNCNGQVAVAGSQEEMPAFCATVKEAGGLAKPLKVSGAFHCPFMQQAFALFEQQLAAYTMQAPALPVYANLTALPYQNGQLAQTLAQQIKSPVRWCETIQNMAQQGFDTFIEVGPGKTLTAFVKRIVPGATLFNVQDEQSLNDAIQALSPQ